MGAKAEIKWRKAQEKETARLAAKYARTEEYEEAARWYRAADVHRSVWRALEGDR